MFIGFAVAVNFDPKTLSAKASLLSFRARSAYSSTRTGICCPWDVQHRMNLLQYHIVLGTSSRWRRQLFNKHFPALANNVTCLSPGIDEKSVTLENTPERSKSDPQKLTLAVARAKAEALTEKCKNDVNVKQHGKVILITLDQVVYVDGRIREKPRDPEECKICLESYRTHPLTTVTAIVVRGLNFDSEDEQFEAKENGLQNQAESVDIAKQYFTDIPDNVIKALIDKGEVLHCAGGITVESELLKPYLAKRVGTMESIMGLPVHSVRELMNKVSS